MYHRPRRPFLASFGACPIGVAMEIGLYVPLLGVFQAEARDEESVWTQYGPGVGMDDAQRYYKPQRQSLERVGAYPIGTHPQSGLYKVLSDIFNPKQGTNSPDGPRIDSI